ncbi:MAG: pili assembly chaperone [Haliea sp.]|jgi:conjugative transfer region protein (TIGR03748 family)|uniref:PFGI-1 class ICE element type IV pilus protein PilL2 n=1 Tax=Haliea sp. TaxID=1932666 RepID=UPI000C5DE1AE|nr:pili assembly chaperone [Haliea sp.]MAD65399.1 pili assembly chaperone [Haliea sp.]MBP71250.1 pili assembly chaperone [Haliea sp.]HAN69548.1 pili assembly chaperone [Halieaceae bacterium]HCD56347.1 pili assembly chaperone [Halieaceae bacterium]
MSLILSLSRSRTVLTGLGAMLLLQCGHLSAQTLVVDRYTVLAATPTAAQQDLLGGIDRIMFPVDVVTVGDALATALYSSGYRLAATEEADASRDILMPLPLPDAHRRLGPMPLRLALQTLAGPAWRLLEDPVYRLVAFERCPNFAEVR